MFFHQPHNSVGNLNYNSTFYKETKWEPHFHKNFELIYVIKGNLDCSINNNKYLLKENQFGLCVSYDIHALTPQEDTEYWVGVFSADFVKSFEKEIYEKSPTGFVFTCSEEILSLFKRYILQENSYSVLTLKACLYAVCTQFLSQIPLTKSNNKNIVIKNIADFISENHKNKISLSDLAEKLGYDYNYVSRYFHKTFGMTFSEFVNIYRLETACDMLINTDKKIASIALESGFQSIRSFNNCFIATIGITPTQYRKK